MDFHPLTIGYLALMILAVVWLGYRAKKYFDREREREMMMGGDFLNDQKIRDLISTLKEKNAESKSLEDKDDKLIN